MLGFNTRGSTVRQHPFAKYSGAGVDLATDLAALLNSVPLYGKKMSNSTIFVFTDICLFIYRWTMQVFLISVIINNA